MHFIHHPSPNWGERPAHSVIDTLVLHYTGMKNATEALQRLCNPEAEVSAHYLIDEAGIIYQLVEPKKRAWHAGQGCWRGNDNINNSSIGIELVNPGHEFGYHHFPEAQMAALIILCQQLISTYPIPSFNVVGHSDIAPLRKQDPGELFNWKELADHGVGLWADLTCSANDYTPLTLHKREIIALQQKLFAFGYGIAATGIEDSLTKATITAFKRHFCPINLNDRWDIAADKLLTALSNLC